MGYAFVIEPELAEFFADEDTLIAKCQQWGLLSDKATKSKAFVYKGRGMNLPCAIVGYVDDITAVVEFDNGQRHCIHPSYLKEMQASAFTQRQSAAAEAGADVALAEETESAGLAAADIETILADESEAAPQAKAAAPRAASPTVKPLPCGEPAAEKKKKPQKLQLPEEKVKLTAIVKEFTTVPNHFADADDEVVVYEAVFIEGAEPVEVGTAWSSHSATLKKLELQIGDKLSFEGKLVTKKLTRHPVPYKINNPVKIQKV